MFRPLSVILAASIALLGATAAHAGTQWSVGINVPLAGVVVSNGDDYVQEPSPVYYAPAPAVRYAPAPVYEAARAYAPARVVYSDGRPVYEVPYRVVPFGGWQGERDSRWERRREFERARWEHTRHEREEAHWDRGEHRWDDGDSRRWRHD